MNSSTNIEDYPLNKSSNAESLLNKGSNVKSPSNKASNAERHFLEEFDKGMKKGWIGCYNKWLYLQFFLVIIGASYILVLGIYQHSPWLFYFTLVIFVIAMLYQSAGQLSMLKRKNLCESREIFEGIAGFMFGLMVYSLFFCSICLDIVPWNIEFCPFEKGFVEVLSIACGIICVLSVTNLVAALKIRKLLVEREKMKEMQEGFLI